MNPTRRNLLASSGLLVSAAALGGASPVLAEQAASNAVPADRLAGDHIDLREFGTMTSDGNITALLQAALNATHENIIRVPWVGNGQYRIDGITLTPGTNLEFHCRKIDLGGTMEIQSGCSVRGVGISASGGILTGPLPRPQFWPVRALWRSIKPLIRINGHNVLFDSVTVGGGSGVGLLVEGSSCLTISNCVLGGGGSEPALRVNSTFWINLRDLQLTAGANGYAAEFVSTIDDGLSTGLVVANNLLIYGRGVLIKPTYGSSGCGAIHFTDIASEGQPAGSALVEIESNANWVKGITITRPLVADPGNWGDTKDVYTIKNSGYKTENVQINDDGNQWLGQVAPGSTAIKGFRTNTRYPILPIYATKWRKDFDFSAGIDAKLVCTPYCGGQLVIGTPMSCRQDPALWVADPGVTVTPNQRAPDGSTTAGLVSGPYGSGVKFGNIQNLQFQLNDWIIGGVWAKAVSGWNVDPSGMAVISMPPAYGGTGWSLNNYGSAIQSLELDGVGTTNGGWMWLTGAYKITAVGADTTPGLHFVGHGKGTNVVYFNPCMTWVKASEGYSDGDVVNAARSMKGGWPSSATAGSAALLDHQLFQIGGGVRVYSDDVSPQAFSPPMTWRRGDICYNSAPTVGQPRGWVCTVAGTPGTWVAMANL